MSASRKHREEFIARISRDRDTLPYATVCQVLRLAATLDRLAVAQCNGDWPADNGERTTVVCPDCESAWAPAVMKRSSTRRYVALVSDQGTAIAECSMLATGIGTELQAGIEKAAPDDAKRPLVWVNVTKNAAINPPVCPDCRAMDAAMALLRGTPWRPVFGGDPRGCVLKLARRTASTEDVDNGRADMAGDVIGVPS